MNKKAQLSNIMNLAVGVAGVAIVLIVTFIVIGQGQDQLGTTQGVACNATGAGSSLECNATKVLSGAIDDIPSWIPIVIIVTIGIALLGLVGLLKMRN